MSSERRIYPRKLTCIPVNLEQDGGKEDIAMIRDVSVGGARLLTGCELAVDDLVVLHLELGGSEPRITSGRVVRVTERERDAFALWRWDVGVEFALPVDDYAEEIDALTRRLQASGVLKG